jgi:hypothetical protein
VARGILPLALFVGGEVVGYAFGFGALEAIEATEHFANALRVAHPVLNDVEGCGAELRHFLFLLSLFFLYILYHISGKKSRGF